jgi:hypothetical protein
MIPGENFKQRKRPLKQPSRMEVTGKYIREETMSMTEASG